MLELARHYPSREAVRVEDLAAEQGIPPNYFVQILIELKAQGIAGSVRGKEGGYLLMRPPAEITFGDVLRAVHGPVFDTPALNEGERKGKGSGRETVISAADLGKRDCASQSDSRKRSSNS